MRQGKWRGGEEEEEGGGGGGGEKGGEEVREKEHNEVAPNQSGGFTVNQHTMVTVNLN